MKKTVIIIAVLIVIIAAIAVVLKNDNQSESLSNISATSIFSLTFEDYNGNTVSPRDFSGRPLVVNSWAAWCPFCRNELPDFREAQAEFGEAVVIIAINRQESLSTAKKYSDELGVTEELIMWLDHDDSFYKKIGGFAMPETLFIDANGVIIEHKRGPMDASEIRAKILSIL